MLHTFPENTTYPVTTVWLGATRRHADGERGIFVSVPGDSEPGDDQQPSEGGGDFGLFIVAPRHPQELIGVYLVSLTFVHKLQLSDARNSGKLPEIVEIVAIQSNYSSEGYLI